jgi:hypothetical protein
LTNEKKKHFQTTEKTILLDKKNKSNDEDLSDKSPITREAAESGDD